MMEQVKKTARQISATTSSSSEKNMEEKEEKFSGSESEEDEDDDLIGPPVPKPEQPIEKSKKEKNDDDESDSNDDSDEDELGQDLTKKIPASHEVCMQHGLKAITAISADPSGARLGEIFLKFLSTNLKFIFTVIY